MGIQDTEKLLQRMARSFPDCFHTSQIAAAIGIDGARAVRAVRGLIEGGLVVAEGSPGVIGMPGSELMLTEFGMVVAFDRAGVEDDLDHAIAALEARTLGQLRRARAAMRSGSTACRDPEAEIGPPSDRRAACRDADFHHPGADRSWSRR